MCQQEDAGEQKDAFHASEEQIRCQEFSVHALVEESDVDNVI